MSRIPATRERAGFCCFSNSVSAYILACPFVNFYLFCTAAICCSIFSSKPESYFLYTICFFLTFSEHFRTIIYKIRSAVKSYFSRGWCQIVFPLCQPHILSDQHFSRFLRLCTNKWSSRSWKVSLQAWNIFSLAPVSSASGLNPNII